MAEIPKFEVDLAPGSEDPDLGPFCVYLGSKVLFGPATRAACEAFKRHLLFALEQEAFQRKAPLQRKAELEEKTALEREFIGAFVWAFACAWTEHLNEKDVLDWKAGEAFRRGLEAGRSGCNAYLDEKADYESDRSSLSARL